ncbi:MAG: trimethylamine methyltransferase family protein [Candidatus Lokiarchaeia archaeon]
MVLKGHTVRKPVNILTDDQVERIHWGSLEVLEKTGVKFEHDGALKIFEEAGCNVDHKEQRVRFPPYLVEECLRKCPSSFTVKARESKNDLRLGGRTLYFITTVGMETLDVDTGARKTPTVEEAADAVKVLDALDEIHIAMCPYFNMVGVSPIMAIPIKTSISIKNTSKFACYGVTVMDADIWERKMADATNQDIIGLISTSPPLTIGEGAITSYIRYAEAGNGTSACSGLNFGGSSPATLAGSLVLNNAELMSCLVLAQLVNPGVRFQAVNYSQPMDMRTGQALLGAVEKGIAGMAFVQMWRHYAIPTLTFTFTDSKIPDYQCAYEKAINTAIQVMAGPNVYSCVGSVYDELTWSPIVAAMDNDILGMTARILDGIDVTDETLAIDLIEEVGPIPGHYLNREHTRLWWKKEQFVPKLAHKGSHPEWIKEGSKSIVERAKEWVEEILATHEPTPLPDDQEKEIDNILKEAEQFYKEKGMLF